MRPMLRPGLSWAWRSDDTVQFGVDDPHPLVITGLPHVARRVLADMDGVRSRDQVVKRAATDDEAAAAARATIDRLGEAGVVVDGGQWPGGDEVTADGRARLLPELMAAVPRDPEAWWTGLATAHVTVLGASRLGAVIAVSLASAGIGRVSVRDVRLVNHGDVMPGGFTSDDVGHPRSQLLIRHPEWVAMRARSATTRELTVVTDAVNCDDHAQRLNAAGFDHLAVSCRERSGRVGPFVIPGRTPCVFCVHLHRRDQDPAWPQLWREQRTSVTPVAHTPTVGVTAQTAVAHIIAWATGDTPPSVGGVVRVSAPYGVAELRPLRRHPECSCWWATMAG